MLYPRIRALRRERNLTQEAVGRAVGVSRRTYGYYETAARRIPFKVLVGLAIFHGTSVDFLVGLSDDPRPYPPSKQAP